MSRKDKLRGSVFDGEIWINDIQFAIEAMAVAVWVQHSFRGRNDDGSETTATWKAATNTNWTQAVDVIFRVRFVSQNTAAVFGAHNPTLYYNHNSAGWNQVSSGSVVRFRDSTNVTNDEATTEQLAGPQSFVAGAVVEDAIAPTVNLTAQDTEFEYVLDIRSSLAADGDTIQLRLQNGTSAYDSYLQVPSITVSETTVPTGTGDGTVTNLTGSASGVRGETGTAAATATNLTGSASGVHGVTGSGAGAVTNLTGSASGVRGETGTAAGTITNLTGSGVGEANYVEGTGAGTVTNLTGAASGVRGETGTAAGTATNLTGSSSGVVGVAGSGAGTATNLTGSSSGVVGVAGSGAGTATNLTGSASGVHGVTGTAAGTVTNLTGAASGSFGEEVAGTGAGTITNLTGSASGVHGVAGTGAGTVTALSGNAGGVHGVAGSSSATATNLTGSAAGVRGETGTAAGTITALSGNASGTFGEDVSGTGAGTVTNLTGAAAGVHGVSGSGAGAVTNLTGSASGYLVVQGTGAGDIPSLTGAAAGTVGEDVVAGGGGVGGPGRARRIPYPIRPLNLPEIEKLFEPEEPAPDPVVGTGAGVIPSLVGLGSAEVGARGSGAGIIRLPFGQSRGTAYPVPQIEFTDEELLDIISLVA